MSASRRKVLAILGTRPEAIKLAPVILAARGGDQAIDLKVCSTGQHRELLEPVFKLFDFAPDYDLSLMRSNQDLSELTARMLGGLGELVRQFAPDLILVQGDTTTAFAGALAGFHARVPVAHVEAGLRTGNKTNPFPEETYRTLLSHLADLHFAPTRSASENLLREGIDPDRVHVTGNTVVDALEHVRRRWEKDSLHGFRRLSDWLSPIHEESDGPLVLLTCHRRESFGTDLEAICRGIVQIARQAPWVRIVFPVHPNPNVRGVVHRLLNDVPNLHLIDPLGYEEFLFLLSNCYLVLTDSGGVQEEAPSFGKPVLVLRKQTERSEAVECGAARVIGTAPEQLADAVLHLLKDRSAYERMVPSVNPYGDGHAARRIVHILERAA